MYVVIDEIVLLSHTFTVLQIRGPWFIIRDVARYLNLKVNYYYFTSAQWYRSQALFETAQCSIDIHSKKQYYNMNWFKFKVTELKNDFWLILVSKVHRRAIEQCILLMVSFQPGSAVQFAQSCLNTGIMHDLANHCHQAAMCTKRKKHFHV